jgi:hypothetical protein
MDTFTKVLQVINSAKSESDLWNTDIKELETNSGIIPYVNDAEIAELLNRDTNPGNIYNGYIAHIKLCILGIYLYRNNLFLSCWKITDHMYYICQVYTDETMSINEQKEKILKFVSYSNNLDINKIYSLLTSYILCYNECYDLLVVLNISEINIKTIKSLYLSGRGHGHNYIYAILDDECDKYLANIAWEKSIRYAWIKACLLNIG